MERGLGLCRSCDDFVVLERFSICTSEQDSCKKRSSCSASRDSLQGSGRHPFSEIPRHQVSASKRIRCNALTVSTVLLASGAPRPASPSSLDFSLLVILSLTSIHRWELSDVHGHSNLVGMTPDEHPCRSRIGRSPYGQRRNNAKADSPSHHQSSVATQG